MKTLKRIALGFAAVLLLGSFLILIEYLGGHPMGLFSGTRPDGLGFNSGKFKPPSWKPNTVSSTIEKTDATHWIEPLRVRGDANGAWERFTAVAKATPGASVVREDAGYLYLECKTPGLGFVDDVEFALDAAADVIHVRSASRLGVRDFGVNRARIEALRARYNTR